MRNQTTSTKLIFKELTSQRCAVIRDQFHDSWYNLASLRCRSRTTFREGDSAKMRLWSRLDYLDNNLFSAHYDQKDRREDQKNHPDGTKEKRRS